MIVDSLDDWTLPVTRKSPHIFPPVLSGHVEIDHFRSHALLNNPWGDPSERELPVYVPPSGETKGAPLLLLLSGYTGAGWAHYQAPRYLRESLGQRIDRLIRTGAMAESLVVAPDCLTLLGGSQYLNSSASGRYEDYLLLEVIPWVREKYGCGPVGVLGTSSGGYGALVLAMRHPDIFESVGSNAGDACFEYCYGSDFPVASRVLRASGGPVPFLERMFTSYTLDYRPENPDLRTLETFCYASAYSPVESRPGTFALPYDWRTGELRPYVWNRWLSWDPVRMIALPEYAAALQRLKYVHVDGGTKDEYYLDVGARIFAEKARTQGVKVDHVEFEGTHADGGPQYDLFVPSMVEAMGFLPRR